MRGERQIQAAMVEAREAAIRNEDKGDWRRWSIKRLFEKLEEEVLEYEQAVRDCDPRRVREELGDVIWVVTMIADHDMALDLTAEEASNHPLGAPRRRIIVQPRDSRGEKVKNYHLGEE